MKFLKPLLNWAGAEPNGGGPANQARRVTVESRIHGRLKTKSPMTLSWQDAAGNRCSIDVQAVDMSSQGARVESPEPMAPGAYVLIEAPKLKLMGSAIVRHCGLRGKKFHIGLDFRNSLTKSY